MKSFVRTFGSLALLTAPALLGGCNITALDDYDKPESWIRGELVYAAGLPEAGQPVGVRTGGVELELWQPGFALSVKIPVYVAQEGDLLGQPPRWDLQAQSPGG